MALLSYEEALELVARHVVQTRDTQSVPFADAAGRVLAQEITAAEPIPGFDNSAVDGYLLGGPAETGAKLDVQGLIGAGDNPQTPPAFGSAMRIFTGAAVPAGSYGIVMQEDVRRAGEEVTLLSDVREGENIRRKGADFGVGELLIRAGTRVNAGTIALLGSQGLATVQVFARPSCAVLTTGEELIDVEALPPPGMIRDTNGPMLRQVALDAGCNDVDCCRIRYDYEETKMVLTALADTHDIVLVAGGASVGDRDFAPKAVREIGEIVFHGVSIKPGKPVWFGRVGSSWIVGLPGNPASAFVCFRLFAKPAIAILGGLADWQSMRIAANVATELKAKERDEFLRANLHFREGKTIAEVVGEQGSFGLRSLSEANALIHLPARSHLKTGDPCVAILI